MVVRAQLSESMLVVAQDSRDGVCPRNEYAFEIIGLDVLTPELECVAGGLVERAVIQELTDCLAAAGEHVGDVLLHCGDVGEECGDIRL
jgi:hypothetical protein